jgi:hypothetical protein
MQRQSEDPLRRKKTRGFIIYMFHDPKDSYSGIPNSQNENNFKKNMGSEE